MSEPQRRVRRRGVVDVGTSLISQLMAVALALGISVVVARALGPSGKGLFSLTTLIQAEAVLVATLGLDVAVLHFVGRGLAEPRVALRAALRSGRAAALLATGVALMVLFGAFGREMEGITATAAGALLLTIPLGVGNTIRLGLVRGLGRIVEASIMTTLGRMVTLCGVAISAWLDLGAPAFLLAVAVGGNAQMLGTTLISRALQAGTESSAESRVKGLSRSLLAFGLKGHGGTVLQALNYRLDMFLVGALTGLAGVGIYSVAVGIAEMLTVLPNALGVVLLHRSASEREDTAAEVTALLTRLSIVGVSAGALLVCLLSPTIIRSTFGEPFMAAVPVVWGLAPGMVALTVWKNLTNALTGLGHPGQKTRSAGAAALMTIPLCALLIPRFGVPGAAYASSAAYSLAAVMAIVEFAKRSRGSPFRALTPRPSDVRCLMEAVRRSGPASAATVAYDDSPPGRAL